MVVDPPGKRYYANEEDWSQRFSPDVFPEDANVSVEQFIDPPEGWHLVSVTIGYLESYDVYVDIRYAAASNPLEIGPGWEGELIDVQWDEGQGWKVESAWDDGVSGLNELDWEVQVQNADFTSATDKAWDLMKEPGDHQSRF